MTIDQDFLKRRWFRKRRITTLLGIIHQSLYYFDYSAIAVSALYYYMNTIKVENGKLYTSLAMSAIFVSGTISSYICGRIMDNTRNLRKLGLFALFFGMVGNLLYCLPFSPWLPVLGRLLTGFNGAVCTIVPAEFSRVYTPKELGKILSKYESFGVIFMSFAPCSPVLFRGVDFNIGALHINEYNCIGLFLASMFLLLMVAFYFGASNLTLDPAYELVKDEILVTSDNIDHNGGKLLLTSKDIMFDFNLMLILSAEGLLGFQYYQLDLLINMTVLYHFNWTITTMAIVTATCVGAASIFLLYGLNQRVNCSLSVYFLYILSFVITALMESCLNLIIKLEIKSFPLQVVFIWSILFMNMIPGFGSTVYCRYLIFSLTPAHSASIAESHRYMFAKVFACLGYFVAAFVFDSMFYWFILYNGICYIIIISLMVRKRYILENNKYDE